MKGKSILKMFLVDVAAYLTVEMIVRFIDNHTCVIDADDEDDYCGCGHCHGECGCHADFDDDVFED